jgi:tetratricopeptide (TPR) repeat protein
MNDDSTPSTAYLPPDGDRTVTQLSAPGAASLAAARYLPPAIGRYRIIRLIGEGGMGAVYEAEQQQPRRSVALKVIKPGIATGQLIRRFEQESQSLARLHHPGIAQVYEAGTAETTFGTQPYFAMELIQGRGLREYVAAERLGTRVRLELMIKICDAVHHAHQRGIIHRDLKPGNILVDETGQPKILDFGVARVTDSDAQATRQTDVGQLIGTVAYMSPEQVLADPLELDIRSDVYTLGVILYELLSGELPYNFRNKLLHEMVQTIREEEAPSLSAMNRIYRGDIETIVAKALEKEKARRYASAAELGADIRRYLDDQPIIARPASATYQLQKFARRHRGLIGGIAAIFVVLVAGIIASSWQAVRASRAGLLARQAEASARAERDRAATAEQGATRERDRALAAEHAASAERDKALAAEARSKEERDRALFQKQRADVESATAKAVNDFLQNDLLAQADSEAQANSDNKPDPEIRVRTVLDRAASRIGGKFDGKPAVEASIEKTIGKTYQGLGSFNEAQRHLERALDLTRRTFGAEHPASLSTARELGRLYRNQGKYAEAESLLTKTVEAYRRNRSLPVSERLQAMDALGEVLVQRAQYARAEPLLREALETAQLTVKPNDPITLNIMLGLAGLYFKQGNVEAAEPLLAKVLEVRSRTLGPEHPWTLSIVNNLGVLYQRQGKYEKAEPLLVKRLEVIQRTNGTEHPDTLNAMNNLGVVYVSEGKDFEAEQLYSKVLKGWRSQLGPEHPRTINLMSNLGVLYCAQRKFAAAESMLHEAWESSRKSLGPEHSDTLTVGHNLADVYGFEGKVSAAETLLVQILDARRRVSGAAHLETASAMSTLAAVRIQQERYEEAESLARESLKVFEEKGPILFRRFRAEALLGASLAAQQKYAEAEPLLLSGCKGMKARAARSLEKVRLTEANAWLAQLYKNLGKPDGAAEWRRELR